MYSRIKSRRLYEQIIEQIQRQLLAGTLRPGDQLPSERELAEQFGVSRTAVREAVKALREKGLVEIQLGKGTFVTDGLDGMSQVMRDSLSWIVEVGSKNGMFDLVEIREVLEPGIAELAATKFQPEEIEAMQQAVAVMDRSMDNADVYVEADLDFHLALAEATQNPLIIILLNPIVDLLREQRKQIFQVEGGPQRGQMHHKRILEMVTSRNGRAAREAMIAHLRQVRKDSGVAVNDFTSNEYDFVCD
jgi:GntR family transcriptional repressor for pyruvate dehydrogenase complex